MIKQLKIFNFRCYENSVITFNGTSILVGKNNAGKSTLIEALKIISSVTRKYKNLRFISAPSWTELTSGYGVSPSIENMNISDRGIFNMYGFPPAIIEANFSNGTIIKAYVGEGLEIFAMIYDSDGYLIKTSKEAKRIDIPIIEVLPQISAVLDNEKVIKKTTVDGNRFTRLASRNFRNQLFYYKEAFPKFKKLVEATWERLRVNPVESMFVEDGQILQFYVRVHNFEAEIGWMGHGLQMWVQTMWFISQCPENSIVILDEPDVYMHADLQRRLVRFIASKFSQLIIATHSLEIIEEVPSDCIVPIDSSKPYIRPIGSDTPLQLLTKELGSPLNIDLARIFVSNRFIVWDGTESDRKVLSAFQAVLHPQHLHPLITYPKTYIKGWKNWEIATPIANIFSCNNMKVALYCISNPGYHTRGEIKERIREAKVGSLNLHVWQKHEIDNYAINVDAILKYITQHKRIGKISLPILTKKIEEVVNTLEGDVLENISRELIANSANVNAIHNMALSNEEIDHRLNNPHDAISGKKFFELLSNWTQENYEIPISALHVIPYFERHEVPNEVASLISKIMSGENL